jgi:hypothetical protein
MPLTTTASELKANKVPLAWRDQCSSSVAYLLRGPC